MSKDSSSRIQLYLDDARDQLDKVEAHLLMLEQNITTPDQEVLNEIFRGIHTIKGGADFLGLNKIRTLSHAAEDVLDLVRNQSIKLDREDLGLLLVVTDTLKEMLADHEQSELIDISRLLIEISRLSSRQNIGQAELHTDATTGDRLSSGLEVEGVQKGLHASAVEVAAEVLSDSVSSQTSGDMIKLGLSSYPALFELSARDVEEWKSRAFNLYIIEYELSHDSSVLMEVFTQLDEIGYLLAYKGPFASAQNAAGVSDAPLMAEPEHDSESVGQYFVLFRTVLSKTLAVRYLNLDPGRLYSLRDGEKERAHSLDVLTSHSTTEGEPGDHSPARQSTSLEEATGPFLSETVNEPTIPANNSASSVSAAETGVTKSVEEFFMSDINEPLDAEIPRSAVASEESRANSTIRVNVNLLDNLMNLAGELVLTRNQLNQNVEQEDYNAINLAAQRLDTVTSELQEAIMSTRMQPISIVLSRFHRMTRDTSQKLGKLVNLVLEGEEVELDKSIIENIGDPLTHLVRNAIDHGIELPAQRKSAGKSEAGTIAIRARHEAGHVVIDVMDDGKGIDVDRVRDRAIEKGIIDRARAEEITEKELLRMIFLPGFSTAESLSDISGRGVGMDVVFTNLSRLGGTIDVDTSKGKGTQFRIKLPLTLAIVPSLLVSVKEEVFAIPQVNLVELVRLPPGQGDKIEYLGDTAVLRLRGKLLPVIWLDEFLNIESGNTLQSEQHLSSSTIESQHNIKKSDKGVIVPFPKQRTTSGESRDSVNVVVVAAGDFHYGIVVDNLTDSEEIVVKPLGTHLRNCHGYAGATILGDGRAALILDVAGISEAASLRNTEISDIDSEELLAAAQESIGDDQKLLVVENARNEYFGIQLAYVNRIERIVASTVQNVGNKQVVKYRGGVLRVFSLEDGLKAGKRQDNTFAYLVIFHMMGVEISVVVSNIIDIVESRAEIDNKTFRQNGVIGSTIVMDRITLLLDLFALVKEIDPAMAADDFVNGDEASLDSRTVLIVEDSLFFQDKLQELLEEMDINVVVAEDGQAGWEVLDKRSKDIDLVLMDVEMPRMTGLELTQKLRGDSRFMDLPIVMLTSLAKESDIDKGREAGASDYLVKMDQEMVKQTILKHLKTARKVA